MRYLTIVVAALVLVAPPAAAQMPDPQIVAPIQKFIDSFNKGDVAAAAAAHAATADLVIIDEVPPYVWHGAKAFQAWGADLESDAKKNGITDPKVTLGAVTRIEKSGDQSYVVVPTVYTFKLRGTSMREAAQMTFVLKKDATGWLIHGWTWTGPKPRPAGGAAKE